MKFPPRIAKARRLEARATRLWNARTLSPDSWQNIVANSLWDQAQKLRRTPANFPPRFYRANHNPQIITKT